MMNSIDILSIIITDNGVIVNIDTDLDVDLNTDHISRSSPIPKIVLRSTPLLEGC